MSEILRAVIYGSAGTQGSKCSFPHPITGKLITLESGKNSRDWRQSLIREMNNDQPEVPFDDAVFCQVRVYVSRPISHYVSGKFIKGLKPNAPRYPKSGRDIDKVQRAIGDAAKIANWLKNDSRIARWDSLRLYTEDFMTPERVEVMMYNMEEHGLDFIDRVMAKVTEGHPIHEDLVPDDTVIM